MFYAAGSRGHANHGWLDTYHSFSFAGYHDSQRIHFGALRVLNDDTVTGGMGFGKHPHDNMEIITIVLDGALEHKDSMGHARALHTGEVQVMSAGTGLMHSEYNHHADKLVNFLQIWIFPNRRGIEPRYDQKAFEPAERINKFQTLVAPIDTEGAALTIQQDAWIERINLQTGKTIDYNLHNKANGLYVFVIEGNTRIDGQVVNKRDAISISNKEAISLQAITDSDILLIEVPMYV